MESDFLTTSLSSPAARLPPYHSASYTEGPGESWEPCLAAQRNWSRLAGYEAKGDWSLPCPRCDLPRALLAGDVGTMEGPLQASHTHSASCSLYCPLPSLCSHSAFKMQDRWSFFGEPPQTPQVPPREPPSPPCCCHLLWVLSPLRI